MKYILNTRWKTETHRADIVKVTLFAAACWRITCHPEVMMSLSVKISRGVTDRWGCGRGRSPFSVKPGWCVWLGSREVFRALTVTDSCDCGLVRTWNEQSDGDYVRWGAAQEAVAAADHMEITPQVVLSSKGWGAVITLHTPQWG